MQTSFLAAANGQALAKNLITGDSYPNVTKVTSFSHQTNTLESLLELLKLHAQEGNCLIKGELTRPLVKESRAGLTKQTATNLLILDIDHNTLPFKDRNHLINTLGFPNTSYIFQHSASSQHNDDLRGHYFILLETPVLPADIKHHVKALNFQHLYKHITLSKNKLSLKWPLDITVNDNGKIIYLTKPIQKTDPITNRFILTKRTHSTHTFIPTETEFSIYDTVNQLRSNEGLKTRDAPVNNIAIINPAEVKITGLEERANNFVYMNLNGGDSWGYYFNKEHPNIVYNFKGEPNFRLQDLCQTTYDKFKIHAISGGGDITLNTDGSIELSTSIGFRDPVLDQYWQVKYNPETSEVTYMHPTSSKERVNDFLVTNGEDRLKHIPDWEVEFSPSSLIQISPERRWINTFKPSEYMASKDTQSTMPHHCEILFKHLTVDKECYNSFMNWLAFVFQTRTKTGTAWILHGTTGTGKGTLFEILLQPIFGYDYTFMATTDQVTEDKNLFMERNLLCVIDEFELKDDVQGSQQYARLRSYITEPIVAIRAMRMNGVKRKSYANFIMPTNRPTCMKLETEDRRMNVAPRQTLPLPVADPEIFRDALKQEVTQFANFLRQYKVNKSAVKNSLKNAARETMIKQSRSSHEEFFYSILIGDIDFFTDQFIDSPDPFQAPEYIAYQKTVLLWIDEAKNKATSRIKKEVLLRMYLWVTGASKKIVTMNKFTSICSNNGLEFTRLKQHPDDVKRVLLTKVKWTGQLEGFTDSTPTTSSNVIKINDA
jgi:hypothetical protein